MRIIAKGTLLKFWGKHPDSKIGLLSWYEKMSKNFYKTPQEIVLDFKDADFVGNDRIVFNIAKNKFRLVVSCNFKFNAIWILFVGTHREYDKIDAKTVDNY
jgi:mRNA interferase HigB